MKEYNFQKEHKDLFAQLKSHIFYGEFESITNWLKTCNIGENKNSTKSLVSAISNNYHYNFFVFSVSSSIKPEMINGKIVTQKQLVQIQEEKRVNSILEFLELEDQLKVLSSQIEDLELSYVKQLKLNSMESKNHLLNNRDFNRYITRLFHFNNFEIINEIEKFTNLNILTNDSNDGYLNYKEKSSRGSFLVPDLHLIDNKKIQFKPYYDIIFNFDMDKHDYLLTKNIKMPTWKESQEIVDTMIVARKNYMNNVWNRNENNDFLDKITLGLENYKQNTFYYELQDKIPEKTTKNKILKI